MTLLQITAIDIDERSHGCCPRAIVGASIGRASTPVDASEIVDDLATGSNAYFAQLDAGQ